MKHGTRIEWTHIPGYKGETWNPITGCSPVSAGCENCYAERISKRFGWPWGSPVFHPERVDQPSRWKKPRAIFVCSMGDLFHEQVSGQDINRICMQMWNNRRHIFLILTKRPERMKRWTEKKAEFCHWQPEDIWPRHIWLGVTAENQETADERIPILLEIPAAKRFVSVEPMLEPVDLSAHGGIHCPDAKGLLDWVICGGESGPKARPMKWEWAIHLLGQCEEAGVPFFMKQMSQHGGADRHDIPAALQVKEFPNV